VPDIRGEPEHILCGGEPASVEAVCGERRDQGQDRGDPRGEQKAARLREDNARACEAGCQSQPGACAAADARAWGKVGCTLQMPKTQAVHRRCRAREPAEAAVPCGQAQSDMADGHNVHQDGEGRLDIPCGGA